jgi:hypothetical protein
MMTRSLSRRNLFAAAAALPSLAQLTPPPAVPSTPDEELAAARNTMQANARELDKVPLPISTEPATIFKA